MKGNRCRFVGNSFWKGPAHKMASIRTVNLLWERRIRGTYPVARHALDNGGTLTLAIPRPQEVRTYDLTRLQKDGGLDVSGSFAVETLLELEVSAFADGCLGMTSDDAYLFHAGDKRRFLGERHIYFVDTALSADGQHIAVGFSDMAGASFALALGDITGRALWTRDVDAALTTVVLAAQGERLAIGTEDGTLWLIERNMRDLWEFTQPEPVRALACSTDGLRVAYGTAAGTVGLIDGTGARRWNTRLNGEIVALALSGDGETCAVLVRPHQEPDVTILTCLTGQGQAGWEFRAERRLTGLSLSPDGRYLATGAKDGTTAVYEIIPGEATEVTLIGGEAVAAARAEYERLLREDPDRAYRALREGLQAVPTDVAFAAEVRERREAWLAERLTKAQTARESRDCLAAIDTLEKLLSVEPREPQAITLLAEVLTERAEQLRAEANRLRDGGNILAAEEVLLEALAAHPFCETARHTLAELRSQRCAEADAEADRLLAEGKIEAGVAALERAQVAAPTSERAAKLERAQTAMEFAAGMAHYNAKRYQEAIFQFKKVLARDPQHAEARRYLNFSQSFSQDASTEAVSDRFNRLE
jgi:tetratricopeptide (TPR) repeat protein